MVDWLDVSDESPRIAYMATAGQTVFQVDFVFYDETDLAVYVDDTLKTLSTHYVTSGAEDENGGTVTFNTAMAGGESVVIALAMPIELTVHIPLTGPLDVPAINLMFSRLVSMLQMVDARRVRALHQPDSDSVDLGDLPTATDRANAYLAFDADGQPMAAADPASYPASAFMATMLDDADAATARATLGITDQSAYSGISNFIHCR